MTITVEEFIYSDEYCGGIPNGKKLKGLYSWRKFSSDCSCKLIIENGKR
ncbi:hypothetical protein [Chryseobacterium indoltheticum]